MDIVINPLRTTGDQNGLNGVLFLFFFFFLLHLIRFLGIKLSSTIDYVESFKRRNGLICTRFYGFFKNTRIQFNAQKIMNDIFVSSTHDPMQKENRYYIFLKV